MQTLTLKRLLHLTLRRRQLDPLTVSLPMETLEDMAWLIRARAESVWTRAFWPDLLRIEERYYRAQWVVSTAYVEDDEVWDSTEEKYYVCVQDNTGQAVTDTDYWEPVTNFDRYVAWDQAGDTAIGTCKQVWSGNPRAYQSARPLAWSVSENGVQVTDEDAGNSVWVEFRLRVPVALTFVEWDSGATYAAGDVCYLDSTGQNYLALAETTGEDPTSTAAAWSLISIPLVFETAVVTGVYADLLREDGNKKKADDEDARTEVLIERAYGREIMQQGQERAVRVRGY